MRFTVVGRAGSSVTRRTRELSGDMTSERLDDCIFCKIVDGEIPAEIVHADETTVAFRDLNPQAPTHVLVVPRSHYENAAELAHHEPAW